MPGVFRNDENDFMRNNASTEPSVSALSCRFRGSNLYSLIYSATISNINSAFPQSSITHRLVTFQRLF